MEYRAIQLSQNGNPLTDDVILQIGLTRGQPIFKVSKEGITLRTYILVDKNTRYIDKKTLYCSDIEIFKSCVELAEGESVIVVLPPIKNEVPTTSVESAAAGAGVLHGP